MSDARKGILSVKIPPPPTLAFFSYLPATLILAAALTAIFRRDDIHFDERYTAPNGAVIDHRVSSE